MENFEDFILEEIEEIEEVAFYLLIPYYRKIIKGIKPQGEHSIVDCPDNYQISDQDFKKLQFSINKLIKKENLVLCESVAPGYVLDGIFYNSDMKPLSIPEQNNILDKKENWIYKKDRPVYFLKKKDGI